MTAEELEKAVAAHHMHSFEDMLVWSLCLAAERQPELLRKAFSKVFSSEATEDMARRAFNVATEAQRYGQEATALLQAVQKQLEDAENYIDSLRHEVELLRGELKRRTA